jgi:hypothetical protein
LQGYDIILGCDWIYDYRPVGINLKTRQFTLEKEGLKITFQDETLPNKDFLVSHKKMKKNEQRCYRGTHLCAEITDGGYSSIIPT